jgi:hypothetical protein
MPEIVYGSASVHSRRGPVSQQKEPSVTLALPPAAASDSSIVQAVGRLVAEFGHQLDQEVVVRVVQSCRSDLSGIPSDALPELVERLARYRLGATEA